MTTSATDLGLRDGSPARAALTKRYLAASVFRRSAVVRRMAAHLGELADYVSWVQSNFGVTPLFLRRESLWERVLTELDGPHVTGVELGVAWGYATQWWLQRLGSPQVRWTGFDTFTGLPAQYRSLGAGTFSAGGSPPDINDSRVQWRIGFVEDTAPGFTIDRREGERVVVLFDLDLYEPSLVAWQVLSPQLKPGDVLYFDEAYDANERRLLDCHVLPSGDFRAIGATTTTLALQLK